MIINEKAAIFNNQNVVQIKLINRNGMEVHILNYGATIQRIIFNNTNRILTYNNIHDYYSNPLYLGSTIGRVAGRIKDARALNLEFERNEGRHHLHSGSAGFSHKFFFIESIKDNEVTLVLDDDSSNSGYIGYMIFKVTFILTDQNELIIKYQAVCDKDTLLSPTNHSYFNLEGNNKDVLNHVLNIDAYLVSELDDEYIPTGTLFNVQKNPAFRLNGNKNIEELIRENHPQLLITHNGFDHAYKLNTNKLTLESQNVKIRLIITTDEEAVVVYTSNKLPQKTCILEGNCAFKKYSGIALEAQAMPNKANTESYREILLKKDSVYNSKSTYKFENID